MAGLSNFHGKQAPPFGKRKSRSEESTDSTPDAKADTRGGDTDEAKSGGKFIANAIKKPGQLHRDLGVPQGQKIPQSALEAAAKRKGKVGQRARFALMLSARR